MKDKKDLSDLAQQFAEKNPLLLRTIMESHFIRLKGIEFSQGKKTRGEADCIKFTNE